MSNDTPYRAPIEGAVRTPAPQLVVAWSDAENANPWKVYVRGYYGFLALAMMLGLVALASARVAGVCAAALGGYFLYRRRAAVAPGFTLDMAGETLAITRAGEAVPVMAALSAVRDVEVERKAIQRVSYHQNFNEAVPSTTLSGDLDVARIVVVFDGDAPRALLTVEYAPVFVCLERFGKVRTFLRSHGWKPAAERDEREVVVR